MTDRRMDSVPARPFENELRSYRCPACGRERMPAPGGDADPVCARCGADLSLSDAMRLQAHSLREAGLRRLSGDPRDAERLLRNALLLEPHPAANRGVAIAAARQGRPKKALALIQQPYPVHHTRVTR